MARLIGHTPHKPTSSQPSHTIPIGTWNFERQDIFDRGARLDTGKPGTGHGLAIVSDVAQIYGGSIHLEESEDLGGLLVRLKLPIG